MLKLQSGKDDYVGLTMRNVWTTPEGNDQLENVKNVLPDVLVSGFGNMVGQL